MRPIPFPNSVLNARVKQSSLPPHCLQFVLYNNIFSAVAFHEIDVCNSHKCQKLILTKVLNVLNKSMMTL